MKDDRKTPANRTLRGKMKATHYASTGKARTIKAKKGKKAD